MSDSKHRGLREAAKRQPELHERILESAEKLFRTLGYMKVTVGDIAKDLGMSSANIYRFYASKAQLREALAERFTKQVESACIEAAKAVKGEPASERLSRMILRYHKMTLALFITAANVHEMLNAALQENWNVVQAHKARMQEVFSRLIEEGVSEGDFKVKDVQKASVLVYRAITAYVEPAKVALMFADDNCEEVKAMSRFLVGALKSGAV